MDAAARSLVSQHAGDQSEFLVLVCTSEKSVWADCRVLGFGWERCCPAAGSEYLAASLVCS